MRAAINVFEIQAAVIRDPEVVTQVRFSLEVFASSVFYLIYDV